jgi:hypothetical protein
VSFSIVSVVLKTLEACVIMSIKVTFAPTPIYSITNGIGLGVTCFSISSIWVLTTTTCTSTNSVGKDKLQKTMVISTPPKLTLIP